MRNDLIVYSSAWGVLAAFVSCAAVSDLPLRTPLNSLITLVSVLLSLGAIFFLHGRILYRLRFVMKNLEIPDRRILAIQTAGAVVPFSILIFTLWTLSRARHHKGSSQLKT